MNIQEVESWHAEAKVLSGYQWRGMQVQFFSFTEWNRVQGRSINSISDKFNLPYVPNWKVSHQLDVAMKNWSTGINQRWISARYSDQNNLVSMQLPSVQLWNVFLSYRFIWKKQIISTQLKCENVTNAQYQEVRSYALPGRVWSIQMNYNIN
jgi:outer membrane cobalamin receptor